MATSIATKTKTVQRPTKSAPSVLDLYLNEVSQARLLTGKEEHALARRIAKGDEKARQQLVEANLRLVVYVAKRYASSRNAEELMDLIQEGNLGLFRAVERYNPKYKTRFSTYAVYWIRQAIHRSLARGRTVRLPENVHGEILQLRRTRHQLYQELGRQPTESELATEMGKPLEDVRQLEEYSQEIVSLDQSITGKDQE